MIITFYYYTATHSFNSCKIHPRLLSFSFFIVKKFNLDVLFYMEIVKVLSNCLVGGEKEIINAIQSEINWYVFAVQIDSLGIVVYIQFES